MTQQRTGTIIVPPGAFPDKHEKITADFLAKALGVDVVFIPPIRRANTRTPDIEMFGFLWEIKSPWGRSPRTIENNLRGALLQSPNIVLNLRRMSARIPTHQLIREAQRQFRLSGDINRIIIITKQQEIVDIR